jgi:hypothetical protein
MSPKDHNVLDRAEAAARRFIRRLGAKGDPKLDLSNKKMPSPSDIDELITKIEEAIEAGVDKGRKGSSPVAPNSFVVSLTYEESGELSDQVLEMLARELKDSAIEFINNRRYSTVGPVTLQVNKDVFAKTVSIRASFERDGLSAGPARATTSHIHQREEAQAPRTLKLDIGGQSEVNLELSPGGDPLYIGRAAGNALRIDDSSISRIHCSVVLRRDGQLLISDLKSANGTTLNGKPLEPDSANLVFSGDLVGVGDIQIRVLEID